MNKQYSKQLLERSSMSYGIEGYDFEVGDALNDYKQSLIQWLEGEKKHVKEFKGTSEDLDLALTVEYATNKTIDKLINHIKEQ